MFWVGRTQNIAAGTSYGLAASHLPFFKLVRIHSSQWLKHLYTVDFRFDLTEEQFLRCSLCFKQKNEWTFMFLGSGAPVLFRILLSCVHRKFQSPVADGSTSEVQDVCCEQRVLARSLPPRSQGKIMSVWWFGTWILWLSVYIYIIYILGMSSSQLTNSIIFQRGRSTTNQMYIAKWLMQSCYSMNFHPAFCPKLLSRSSIKISLM